MLLCELYNLCSTKSSCVFLIDITIKVMPMEQPDFLYPNEKFLKYYPDYAYNHALFTNDMRIYSDSKISDFLQEVTIDQRIRFLNEWNAKRDHREKIYISYDSTNKVSQAGDIDLVELGHAREGVETDIFNYSIAFDTNKREPLFYESYPGSIVDVSQLQHTLKKAKSYGYEYVGFILDRGYFCKENIQFMDENGYQFVIMAEGMKKLVSELVLEVQGTFENDRNNSIRAYKVSGTTVKRKLFAADKKERYFHIFYDDGKKASERERFENRIDRMGAAGKKFRVSYSKPGGNYRFVGERMHLQRKLVRGDLETKKCSDFA